MWVRKRKMFQKGNDIVKDTELLVTGHTGGCLAASVSGGSDACFPGCEFN